MHFSVHIIFLRTLRIVAPVIVTGKVVDEQGAPMAGVTIIEEGGVNSKRDFGFTPSLIYRMVNPAFYAFMNPGLA